MIAATHIDADEAWQALLNRDRRYDGRLIFAVTSTGVYCRPGCPARRPHRQNVRFYATPAEARAAGFRACKRCLPDGPADAQLVEAARRLIDAAPDDVAARLPDLSAALGISPRALARRFRAVTGVSLRQYAAAQRLSRLKQGLRSGDSVTEAAFEAGYGALSRVYEGATAHLGMTPGAYRRRGAGLSIRFATAETSLGVLLVASTARGVCFVAICDDAAAATAALRDEFPAATIEQADGPAASLVEALAAQIEGRQSSRELPLDLRGTPFQLLVWQALQSIPAGETRSYGAIARQIGRPGAARAVGRACASNPAAIVVPCHRAVRSDGGDGGYRWGIERKQALLHSERTATQ